MMIRIITVWLMTCLLIACIDDRLSGGRTDDKGTYVTVSFKIELPPLASPTSSTRAGTDSNEDAEGFSVLFARPSEEVVDAGPITKTEGTPFSFYNLWLFQAKADGTIRLAKQLAGDTNPIPGNATIETDLLVGTDQTVYLVSLGEKIHADLSEVATLADLKKFSINLHERNTAGDYVSLVTRDSEMPYAGSVAGLKIISLNGTNTGYIDYAGSAGFDGLIRLNALLAKVSYHFSYKPTTFTPSGIGLYQIPSAFTLDPTQNTAPSYIGNTAVLGVDALPKDAAGRYVATWYMPQNPAESVAGCVEDKRHRVTAKNGLAPEKGTFIELGAQEKGKENWYAYYTIYLGNNMSDNFNVDAGSYYNLRSDMTIDKNDNDGRIRYQTSEFKILNTGDATVFYNKPESNAIATWYNSVRDAHPSRRRIEISALRGILTVELQKTTDGKTGTLMDLTSGWARISSSSNYTEAVQYGNFITKYEKRFNIPGKEYLHIYSDEYENYDYYPRNKGVMRNAIIKVSMTTLDGTPIGTPLFCYINQAPAQYVGNFGGTFEPEKGEYSHGLAVEAVREQNYIYGESEQKPNTSNAYGFNNISLSTRPSFEEVGSRYSGKKATWDLVYEAKNQTINTGINSNNSEYFENPIFSNETDPDLYQYQYKRTYAARICFDRNRDTNGNGKIDEDEFFWYLPSQHQLEGIYLATGITLENKENPFFCLEPNNYPLAVTTEVNSTTIASFSTTRGFSAFSMSKTNGYVALCVRDISKRK